MQKINFSFNWIKSLVFLEKQTTFFSYYNLTLQNFSTIIAKQSSMRMGRASCNEHTVHVHSVLEKKLPPEPKLKGFPFCHWIPCCLPYKLHIPGSFWTNKATLLWLRPAEPMMFGGWIHRKSHILSTHSQYLTMALLATLIGLALSYSMELSDSFLCTDCLVLFWN